jgi:hypothetical protein
LIKTMTIEEDDDEEVDDDEDDEEDEDVTEDQRYRDSDTMSDDDTVKSDKGSGSRIPKVKKDQDWDMFEHKFLAYAEDKNFIDVIEQKHPLFPDRCDGDLTSIQDKKVRKILKQNRKAAMDL